MKRFLLIVVCSLLLPGMSLAGEGLTLLSDAELDEVTAQGVDFGVQLIPGEDGSISGIQFDFATGGTTGNGNVLISPSLQPSMVINGNAVFSNSNFFVDNMVFNLNVCVSCSAHTITQSGQGIPITIQTAP